MAAETTSGRRYGGTSAVQRAAERRRKLIDAAAEIIGTEGFQAATVRAVCGGAKLTERYFYESFPSREDMLMAVYEDSVAVLRQKLLEGVSNAPPRPEAMARAAVTVALTWMKEDPRQARILYFEMLGSSETLGPIFLEYTKAFADLVRTLLTPIVGGNTARGYDDEVMATAIVGAFNHVVLRWALTDYETPLDVMVDNCVGIFTALIQGVTPSPAQGETP